MSAETCRQHVLNRKYLLRVAVINLAAATAAIALAMWFGGIASARALGITFFEDLVYAYTLGSLCGLLLPFIAVAVEKKPVWVKIVSLGSGILVLTLAGCAIAGGILILLKLADLPSVISNYVLVVKFATVIGLVAGLGVFFFESMRIRLQETRLELRERQLAEERAMKLAAEARLSSLESHIHPHFLFNTLNSIAALIHEDPNRAEEMVGRLAALLRFSLDANQRRLVPLAQELKIVRDYLEIEKARLGDRLRYTVEAAPGLHEASVPPLAVESLVENSIKHTIASKREGGEVHVRIRPEGGRLTVEVADTGPGFDLAAVPPGHGIDNLRARLEALYNGAARLETSRRDGVAAVRMLLPEAQ